MEDHENPSPEKPLATVQKDDTIQLQVGERHFTTLRSTLVAESTFFESLLSGRWNNARDDMSYFVDADPGLFEHVLRYLRHKESPVFYDRQKGHDYSLYHALLGEAKYFGIGPLIDYLEKQAYLDMVTVHQTLERFELPVAGLYSRQIPSDTFVEYRRYEVTKKVYVCPRGVAAHRGDPAECGRKCNNKQRGYQLEYHDEVKQHVLAVSTKVSIKTG
ncbi:hypothetical protein BJX70DRAFT_359435 [Aspergillus crustosus]